MARAKTSTNWLEYWYFALREVRGYRFKTSKPHQAKMRLYEARRNAGDPALAALSIVIPKANGDELWIVHKQVPIENDQTEE